MSSILCLLSLLALWACYTSADYTPVVSISTGLLRGVTSPKGYYSYLGIPFGTVEKRFQAAKPVTWWDGILDATEGNVQCKQKNPLSPISATLFQLGSQSSAPVTGSNDCLLLNVYTNKAPNEPQPKLRPVMVYIFPSAFLYGSGSHALYGPEFLVEKDVVVVTFNHRLDILGFLCLGIEEAPGNAGLKDQVLALKWVQKNIIAFGGDPDNVTLFGHSSGGSSVGLHMISPMSKKLFHKAIMQSGSPLALWVVNFEPLKTASELATLMGYNTTDPHELYEIFMNKSIDELQLFETPRKLGTLYAQQLSSLACVENDIPGVEPFLSDTPFNLLKNNSYTKVPVIIGHTSKEMYSLMNFENETTIANINDNFRNTLYGDLIFPSEDVANEIANTARQMYFGNESVNRTNLVDYAGDLHYVYNIYATIDLLLKTNNEPMYGYDFAYNGTRNLMKQLGGFKDTAGAGHVDDIYYLWERVYLSTDTATEQDKAIIGKLTTMWTDFAKYGNPTPECSQLPEWEPLAAEDPTLLVIDEQLSTRKIWDSERMQFWNDTYSKYRRTTAQAWPCKEYLKYLANFYIHDRY